MPVSQRTVKTLFCAGLLALLSSCGFSSGHDYAVTVTWLINGTAPSLALCQANSVDRIRFTVRTPSKRRTLEAPCESSINLTDYDTGDTLPYGGFTSTESFNYEVSYRYEVEMLDSKGNPIKGLSYEDSFQVFYEDEQPWPLRPLELFAPLGDTAAVDGIWQIAGKDPTTDACAQLGAAEIAIDVASSTDSGFSDPVEVARGSCVDGGIVTDERVLAEGEYFVRYVALSAEGDELAFVELSQVYLVDVPGVLQIDGADFDLP